MKNLTVGNILISRVVETEGPFLQPQQLLPEAKAEVIESHKHWLAPHFIAPDGMFIMSIHTYVVCTKHHTILVDTCVNGYQPSRMQSTSLLRKNGSSGRVNTMLVVRQGMVLLLIA